jgi:protein SCO1
VPLALLLVVAGVVSFALLRGSSKTSPPGGALQARAGGGYYGTLTLPSKQAPPLRLRNYLGQPVTLAGYRGKAVLVTFLYTHCPDVCPLIASNLGGVLKLLGARAARTQVIAVSVDPRGDTRAAVAKFLRARQMLGRMQYLTGSARELERTWAAWSVGATRQAGKPDLIAHSALIYGIAASGKLTTVYPESFEPSEISHDVPKLLAG